MIATQVSKNIFDAEILEKEREQKKGDDMSVVLIMMPITSSLGYL